VGVVGYGSLVAADAMRVMTGIAGGSLVNDMFFMFPERIVTEN
jgi:hypothetical protein